MLTYIRVDKQDKQYERFSKDLRTYVTIEKEMNNIGKTTFYYHNNCIVT